MLLNFKTYLSQKAHNLFLLLKVTSLMFIIQYCTSGSISQPNRLVDADFCRQALSLEECDNDGISSEEDLDDDGDGLIEISTAVQLNNIRYVLDGSGYQEGSNGTKDTMGCNPCSGYELINDIDLSSVENWEPVGTTIQPFTANFQGNGYRIFNLVIESNLQQVGFWGSTSNSTIEQVHIEVANVRATSTASLATDPVYVGAFVGYAQSNTTILNSSIQDASILADDGDYDHIGLLVGFNLGSIKLSFATGSASAGNGLEDIIGGLVGKNVGVIEYSYAMVSVDAVDGITNSTGGLVGLNNGTINATFSTGDVYGGDGRDGDVGGLVGLNTGDILNSYATGNAFGEGERFDTVGGLVGYSSAGNIINSYAIGDANAGMEQADFAGGLQGSSDNTNISQSYYDDSSKVIGVVISYAGTQATADLQGNTNLYTNWDRNIWDLEDNNLYPALKNEAGQLLIDQVNP